MQGQREGALTQNSEVLSATWAWDDFFCDSLLDAKFTCDTRVFLVLQKMYIITTLILRSYGIVTDIVM